MKESQKASNMKATLKQLRQVKAEPAVSIFVSTHRKHPENQQDPIALKNQLSLAEERLSNEYDKRTAAGIMAKIHEQTEDLDHNYNLDTLAIFATADEATLLRLPIDVKERVIIDTRFATRDLVRDLSSTVHYYVVVVTREHGRLIEAANGRVIREFDRDDDEQQDMRNMAFPIENTTLYTTSGADRSAASNEDNYLKEFLNRIDKSVQELWGLHPLPLVVVGDARNVSFYREVCDRADNIIAGVENITELDSGSPEHIVEGVQEAIENYRTSLHKEAKSEIDIARSDNRVRTDLQTIYQKAFQGNGQRLYLRQGYMQPAIIDEAAQTLTLSDDPAADGVTDDAVGEIIEHVMNNGGDVVFLPEDILGKDQPIALVTRF